MGCRDQMRQAKNGRIEKVTEFRGYHEKLRLFSFKLLRGLRLRGRCQILRRQEVSRAYQYWGQRQLAPDIPVGVALALQLTTPGSITGIRKWMPFWSTAAVDWFVVSEQKNDHCEAKPLTKAPGDRKSGPENIISNLLGQCFRQRQSVILWVVMVINRKQILGFRSVAALR